MTENHYEMADEHQRIAAEAVEAGKLPLAQLAMMASQTEASLAVADAINTNTDELRQLREELSARVYQVFGPKYDI